MVVDRYRVVEREALVKCQGYIPQRLDMLNHVPQSTSQIRIWSRPRIFSACHEFCFGKGLLFNQLLKLERNKDSNENFQSLRLFRVRCSVIHYHLVTTVFCRKTRTLITKPRFDLLESCPWTTILFVSIQNSKGPLC